MHRSDPGTARRLRDGRVPRIGWAPVDPGGDACYFAHSYGADGGRHVRSGSNGVTCRHAAGTNRRERFWY